MASSTLQHLCFPIPLQMKSKFQNSHDCPKINNKIPLYTLVGVGNDFPGYLPTHWPRYLPNLRGQLPDNCLPRTRRHYHSPPLSIAFYHHLKCPSPDSCVGKCYLFLKAQLRHQLLWEKTVSSKMPSLALFIAQTESAWGNLLPSASYSGLCLTL